MMDAAFRTDRQWHFAKSGLRNLIGWGILGRSLRAAGEQYGERAGS